MVHCINWGITGYTFQKYWISISEDWFCPSKQCRPWWNAAYSCISSGSSLFVRVPVKGFLVHKGLNNHTDISIGARSLIFGLNLTSPFAVYGRDVEPLGMRWLVWPCAVGKCIKFLKSCVLAYICMQAICSIFLWYSFEWCKVLCTCFSYGCWKGINKSRRNIISWTDK